MSDNILITGAAISITIGIVAVAISVVLGFAYKLTGREWMATAGLWLALFGCASGITTALYGIMMWISL